MEYEYERSKIFSFFEPCHLIRHEKIRGVLDEEEYEPFGAYVDLRPINEFPDFVDRDVPKIEENYFLDQVLLDL